MPTTVTMLQTRRGEDGNPWLAGQSYSASDEFANLLIVGNYATGSRPGAWLTPPSVFRLRITGTGTLQMDSRDSLGNITLATFPLTSYTGETDKIEFPYAGDDAVAIRVTLTGTLTCEVI